MRKSVGYHQKLLAYVFLSMFLLFMMPTSVFADVFVNILAVNGTDEAKEKDVKQYLPKELTAEDILESPGLKVDYDVNEGAYFVYGKIALGPKESKKIQIRVRDIWLVAKDEIEDIREQVDIGLNRIKETEYYDTGLIKKDTLLDRLDFIVKQEEQYADNVNKRIDHHRIYEKEMQEIRSNSLSVKYWRSKPPAAGEADVISFIIEMENSKKDETISTEDQKHYLPPEVKPENIVDLQGFEVKYDAIEGKSYLTKKEVLKPGQTKRYTIGIVDVWNVAPSEIDYLKSRTEKAFKLLEKTTFFDSAQYLVENISKNLKRVEETQQVSRQIKEHIGTYRVNLGRYESAERDVEALEDLLEAAREELERSQLKKVLQKIKSIKGIAEIAKSIFKKPENNTAWKIIAGIVIFVGVLSFIHFVLWGQRSKDVPIKREEEEQEKEEEQKV